MAISIACVLMVGMVSHGDDPRFARRVPVEGQPVVTDSVTGIIWQGCAAGLTGDDCSEGEAGLYDWQVALAYCEGLDWGGRDDWRLPNVLELSSINNNRTILPTIDSVAFPESPGAYYWSSTPLVHRSSSHGFGAWAVAFHYGGATHRLIEVEYFVRCIRRGP